MLSVATIAAQQAPPVQQPPPGQQPPVFRAGTERVRMDVLVTHRGRPVEGLTAADFELKDNGVVQALERATTAGRVSVAIAFDTSGRGGFEELRQAAFALTDALQPDDQAWLITFSATFQRQIGPTTDTSALRRIIAGIRPTQGAAMWDALFGSVALIKGTEGRSLVVALTNGLDSSSYLDEERTLDVLRRGEVVINGVRALRAFDERDYGGFVHLEAMTQATGGRILASERRDRMAAQFGGLLQEFRLGYILSYSTNLSTRRDGWHDVEIKLKDKPGSVRARKGYYDQGR